MNELVKVQAASPFEGLTFGSLIKTTITLRSGKTAHVVTLLTEPQMFQEAVKGVNNGLKSGELSEYWSSQVFTLSNGEIKPFATFATVSADNLMSETLTVETLRNEVVKLRRELAAAHGDACFLRNRNNKLFNDLIEAHKKIGALQYHLEKNGVELPEL